MEERIQKILAQAGFGSRRDCETFILARRVTVNGKVAELGQKADPQVDKILLDGRPVQVELKVYVALHKPRFVLSTVEPEPGDSRKTVRELVPVEGRLFPVGRLDFDSEGLVLMTNDGELANKLTHPRFGHEKEYRVLLARQPDQEQLGTWRRGVVLEDEYKTQPADVYVESKSGKGAWVRITMREGRKRQIREIGALLGLPVVRILRVRIGQLLLGGLKPGEWRHLSADEVKALQSNDARRPAVKPQRQFRSKTAGQAPGRGRKPGGRPPAGEKSKKQYPPRGGNKSSR